jgi:hypothetical protein
MRNSPEEAWWPPPAPLTLLLTDWGGVRVKRIFMWVLLAVAVLSLVFGTGARYHHYRTGSQPADMYVQPGDMYGQPADMY